MPFRWDGGGGATRSGGSIEGGMPAGPVPAAAASAAGDTHVTRHGGRRLPAVDHEVMALRLAGNRLADGSFQIGVAVGGAQRAAQVGGIVLAEAHVPRADRKSTRLNSSH